MSMNDQLLSPSLGERKANCSRLLAVCIPTYNRSAYLDQCLAALVPQAMVLGVQIFLSDNGSTDTTPDVIAKYQALYEEGVKCVRQQGNLGYDLNHKAVIEMVHSEFAWLLGDDDVMVDGALQRVINELEADPHCELMLLNAMLTDNDLHPRDRQFHIDRNVLLTNCNDLLKHHSDKLTFGMMVINARLFNETDAERFIGTAHYYAGGVYEYLAGNYLKNGSNRICILKEPFVYLRQGERQWSQSIGDISVRQIPEFYFRMHPCYDVNAREAMKRAVGSYRTLLPLVRLRAEGWLDRKRAGELKKYYVDRYRYRLLLISNMPMFAAQCLSALGVLAAKTLKAAKRTYFANKINMTDRIDL